jgi:molybdenum cofactor cytidylyltransferase
VERLLASAVDEVVVVLGRDARAVENALDALPVRCVVNARYAEGMSTSLHAGLTALTPGARAAVVALGDQPTVTPAIVDALVGAYAAGGAKIVAAAYQGVRGNPVLFDASLFPELLRTAGDEGARAVIAAEATRVRRVDFPFPMPHDVDTPEDRAVVEREWRERGGGGGSV